jgi:hypothetical protein
MDPALAALSAQTAINPSYYDAEINYDQYQYQVPHASPPQSTAAVYQIPPAPLPQMAAPVPVQQPHYPPEQQLFRTQAVNYARQPAPIPPTLFLAQACGNCARSYGAPLVCAALKTEVSPLSVCENFSSPLDLI